MKHVMISKDSMAPSIRCSTGKKTDMFTKYLMHQQQQPPKHSVLNTISIVKQSKIGPQFSQKSSSGGSVVGKNASNQGNFERRPILTPNHTHLVPSSGGISFKCLLCSMFFRTQAFLNEHMRKEHSVLI